MEFGVFAQLFVPKFERAADPHAEHKRIMRNVDIAVAADRNAFKYVWCPQHHFLDEYSHMPGPEAFLGHCSAITERVHLGSAIFNITPPVNKPVRIAENVALLDHLSNNRFEFGTGRGSCTTEVYGFDIADINETKAMWREAIDEIPKMWKHGTYSYEGEYFRVPEREVFPKPHGPAHPAMWVAAGSPPTFGEAGRAGPGRLLLLHGCPRQAVGAGGQLQGQDRPGHPGGRLRERQHHGRHQHALHGGPQEGLRGRRQHGDELLHVASPSTGSTTSRSPTGSRSGPSGSPSPPRSRWSRWRPAASSWSATRTTAPRACSSWADVGFDQLTFSPTTNTLSTDVVVQSMELFGREVIPQFDKDPVHSTTRYREAASQ